MKKQTRGPNGALGQVPGLLGCPLFGLLGEPASTAAPPLAHRRGAFDHSQRPDCDRPNRCLAQSICALHGARLDCGAHRDGSLGCARCSRPICWALQRCWPLPAVSGRWFGCDTLPFHQRWFFSSAAEEHRRSLPYPLFQYQHHPSTSICTRAPPQHVVRWTVLHVSRHVSPSNLEPDDGCPSKLLPEKSSAPPRAKQGPNRQFIESIGVHVATYHSAVLIMIEPGWPKLCRRFIVAPLDLISLNPSRAARSRGRHVGGT